MSETKQAIIRRSNLARQGGVAAVEFAFVVLIFLTLVYGVLEMARAMYICNTLQEVTRRAAAYAATTDFSDPAAMQRVRQLAVFRNTPGYLTFAEPVTDAHVKIDYLSVARDGGKLTMVPIPSGSLPASPGANHVNCLSNPNDESCIRFVRARICLPGGGSGCDNVPYQSILSLVPFVFPLPDSTTIATAETFGRPAGVPGGPCEC